MSTEEGLFRAQIRVMQIITVGLVMGLVTFLGITIFMVWQQGKGLAKQHDLPIITYVALGFFVLQILLWQIIPNLVAKPSVIKIAQGTWIPSTQTTGNPALIPASDQTKLAFVYQTRLIVGCALLESAGFLACIAYLLEADTVAIALAGIVLLLMLSCFPTPQRVQSWVEHQLMSIQEMRQRGETQM